MQIFGGDAQQDLVAIRAVLIFHSDHIKVTLNGSLPLCGGASREIKCRTINLKGLLALSRLWNGEEVLLRKQHTHLPTTHTCLFVS